MRKGREEENASVLYRYKRGILRRLCRKYGGIKKVLFGIFSAQKKSKRETQIWSYKSSFITY